MTTSPAEPPESTPPCGDECPGECGWNPADPMDPCAIDSIKHTPTAARIAQLEADLAAAEAKLRAVEAALEMHRASGDGAEPSQWNNGWRVGMSDAIRVVRAALATQPAP